VCAKERGEKNKWMDEWMNARIDEWMDGRMEG
jgi:hypothetical protein